MDKTPGQVDSEELYWEFDARKKGYAEWKGMPQSERDAFKAVIAHVTPAIRAAAIEDAASEMQRRSDRDKMRANEQTGVVGFGVIAAFAACYNDAAAAIRALAPLPPGHVCVPTRPERERINAGAERLLRWQDDTKPEDFSGLQWAEARQDAERVYLSMVQYDAAAKEPK